MKPAHGLYSARSTTRAPCRVVGLGREKHSRQLGRSGKSRPSVLIQRARGFCTQTKPRRVNPSAHNLSRPHSFTPSTSPRRSQREEDGGVAAGPLAGACAHRWVDAPPSSGSSTGSTHAHPPGFRSGGVLRPSLTLRP
jgi:hypothetical protein